MRWRDIAAFAESTTWREYITSHTGREVGGYSGYRLRKSPTTEAEILVTLDTDLHVIHRWTGRTRGPWAEAEVWEAFHGWREALEEEWCTGSAESVPKPRETWKGWLKVVEDDGRRKDLFAARFFCD